MITAIILAAGRGSRIGCPKWQLKYQGKTFLELIIDNLLVAQLADIVCVINADSVPPLDNRIQIAINPAPEQGMFSSVLTGVLSVPESAGYLIIPVDHPFVKPETIKKLINAFNQNNKMIVRPIYNNRAGHPIIVPGYAFATNDHHDESLKQLLISQKIPNHDVIVDDPAILTNINTQGDLDEYKNIS